jgi:predicted Na+-dependent transporter
MFDFIDAIAEKGASFKNDGEMFAWVAKATVWFLAWAMLMFGLMAVGEYASR